MRRSRFSKKTLDGTMRRLTNRKAAAKTICGCLQFQEQLVRTDVQSFCDFQQDFDGGSAFAAFDSSDIIRMNVGSFGERFLAQPCFFTAPEDGVTNNFALRFSEHSGYENRILKNSPHTLRVVFAPFFLANVCDGSIKSPTEPRPISRDSEKSAFQIREVNLEG
jgi:hypothetical protein